MVSIDSVIYFQVTDPKAATYEIANYIQAIEQLTVTTLRNVIGGMDLERTLTSRDEINSQLRGVLDEATGKWGIRVNRVELKAIDPPRVDPGGDGEADARRPGEARRDPHGRGRQAVADPDRRGREAGGDPPGRRCSAQATILAGRGGGAGDRHGLQGDPRRATPTRSCSPTSTSRCCRRSRRATRTRSGSSRARSRRRSGGSARSGSRAVKRVRRLVARQRGPGSSATRAAVAIEAASIPYSA